MTHLGHEVSHERVHERFLEIEEGEAVADGATEDAADDVAGACIGGQLTIGDGKGDGAQVIGHYAQRNVHLMILPVLHTGILGYLLDDRLKHIRIIIGFLVLHGHAQALKAHAGIYMFVGQQLKFTRSNAIVLHEHEVPNLDHQGIVLIHKLAAGHLDALGIIAQVNVDFGAGTARTSLTHLPKIVFLVALQDAVFGQVVLPEIISFLIEVGAVLLVTLENGGIETVFV